MNCPVCGSGLVAVERQGIEIDHCPRCRGVWLDRGELDKLIERSTQFGRPGRDDDSDWGDDRRRSYGQPQHSENRPKKKEGFFGRLFDFD